MKRAYNVMLNGCDDETQTVVQLTNNEAAAVRIVADAVVGASRGSCQPRMKVWLVGDPEPVYPEFPSDGDGGAA